MRRLLILLVLLAVGSAGERLSGEERSGEAGATTIVKGQPIAEAIESLRELKIEWHQEEGYGEAGSVRGPKDNDGYSPPADPPVGIAFHLDKATYAKLTYSRETERITGISLTVYPLGRAGKMTESRFFAKSLRLEPDGSYVVHMLPRKEPQPIAGPISEQLPLPRSKQR